MSRKRIPTWIKNIVEIEKGTTCGICGRRRWRQRVSWSIIKGIGGIKNMSEEIREQLEEWKKLKEQVEITKKFCWMIYSLIITLVLVLVLVRFIVN